MLNQLKTLKLLCIVRLKLVIIKTLSNSAFSGMITC